MSEGLLKNKSAQAAYRLSRSRRYNNNRDCFCGQSMTAMVFAIATGYSTLLIMGLHFVSKSSHGFNAISGNISTSDSSTLANTVEHPTDESMLPVIFVMAFCTSFGFLGPLQDNPFTISRQSWLALSLAALVMYCFMFWTYQVQSLLGISCSAMIVSVVLQPVHSLVVFCLPDDEFHSLSFCACLYQLLFMRRYNQNKKNEDKVVTSGYDDADEELDGSHQL